MSTDDEEAAEVGARPQSRFRSVVAEGARRSQALLRSRPATDPPGNGGPVSDRPPADAGQDDRDGGGQGPSVVAAIGRATDEHVPAPLRNAAAWAWRMLLVAAVVYLAFKVAVALRLLVLPFIAATLLCALLQPLASLLRASG